MEFMNCTVAFIRNKEKLIASDVNEATINKNNKLPSLKKILQYKTISTKPWMQQSRTRGGGMRTQDSPEALQITDIILQSHLLLLLPPPRPPLRNPACRWWPRRRRSGRCPCVPAAASTRLSWGCTLPQRPGWRCRHRPPPRRGGCWGPPHLCREMRMINKENEDGA